MQLQRAAAAICGVATDPCSPGLQRPQAAAHTASSCPRRQLQREDSTWRGHAPSMQSGVRGKPCGYARRRAATRSVANPEAQPSSVLCASPAQAREPARPSAATLPCGRPRRWPCVHARCPLSARRSLRPPVQRTPVTPAHLCPLASHGFAARWPETMPVPCRCSPPKTAHLSPHHKNWVHFRNFVPRMWASPGFATPPGTIRAAAPAPRRPGPPAVARHTNLCASSPTGDKGGWRPGAVPRLIE